MMAGVFDKMICLLVLMSIRITLAISLLTLFAANSLEAELSLKKAKLACEHALTGSPQATRYLRDYFLAEKEFCSAELYDFILKNLNNPSKNITYSEDHRCLWSKDVKKLAFVCIENISLCLFDRRSIVANEKQTLFTEYYLPQPLGWPTYSQALELFFQPDKLICSIE